MRPIVVVALAIFATRVGAQVEQRGAAKPPSAAIQQLAPSAPATKLEAATDKSGAMWTLAFSDIGSTGSFGSGTSVQVREIRDGSTGQVVRGLVIEVQQDQYRDQRAFVDTDEIPGLIAAVDSLLAVNQNPSPLRDFEIDYRTRGRLEGSVFSSRGALKYAVKAGEVSTAISIEDKEGMQKLRSMLAAAQQTLASLK